MRANDLKKECLAHNQDVFGFFVSFQLLVPDWLNRTINVDTGCVFGGNLTALRYPEKELVSVAARATYAQPVRPLAAVADSGPSLTSQQVHDHLLDTDDVIGKRIVDDSSPSQRHGERGECAGRS